MKLTAHIKADDGDVIIAIDATITSLNGFARMDEVKRIKRVLTDRLMSTLVGLPYTQYHLSTIKVERR